MSIINGLKLNCDLIFNANFYQCGSESSAKEAAAATGAAAMGDAKAMRSVATGAAAEAVVLIWNLLYY